VSAKISRIILWTPPRDTRIAKGADALGPGGFVVPGAFDTLVMEVLAELPAILQEHVAKFFDIVNDARAFVRTDVEPDARRGSTGAAAAKR